VRGGGDLDWACSLYRFVLPEGDDFAQTCSDFEVNKGDKTMWVTDLDWRRFFRIWIWANMHSDFSGSQFVQLPRIIFLSTRQRRDIVFLQFGIVLPSLRVPRWIFLEFTMHEYFEVLP
jgi:hypothetical protein